MKPFLKKISIVFFATILAVFAVARADTIYSLPQWKIVGNTLIPVVTSSSVQIPSLATSTPSLCLSANASGTLSLVSCGSGSGSATTTISYGGTTSTGPIFNFASSTYIVIGTSSNNTFQWLFVNAAGFLTNASITPSGPITWSAGSVIGMCSADSSALRRKR